MVARRNALFKSRALRVEKLESRQLLAVASPMPDSRQHNLNSISAVEPAAPYVVNLNEIVVNEGAMVKWQARAVSPNSKSSNLRFTLSGDVPTGLSLSSKGQMRWQTNESQGGSTRIVTFTISDGKRTVEQLLPIRVVEVNSLPTMTAFKKRSVAEEVPFSFSFRASDSDLPVQTLTYQLLGNVPTGATISETGDLQWTPTEAQGPQRYQFRVAVSDGTNVVERPIDITVLEVNTSPTLTVPAAMSSKTNSLITFAVQADDADLPRQPLIYRFGGKPPAGAKISSEGVFAWTPSLSQAGAHEVIIVVSDAKKRGFTSQKTVKIVVEDERLPATGAAQLNLAAARLEIEGETASIVTFQLDMEGNALTHNSRVWVKLPGKKTYDELDRTIQDIDHDADPSTSAICRYEFSGFAHSTSEAALLKSMNGTWAMVIDRDGDFDTQRPVIEKNVDAEIQFKTSPSSLSMLPRIRWENVSDYFQSASDGDLALDWVSSGSVPKDAVVAATVEGDTVDNVIEIVAANKRVEFKDLPFNQPLSASIGIYRNADRFVSQPIVSQSHSPIRFGKLASELPTDQLPHQNDDDWKPIRGSVVSMDLVDFWLWRGAAKPTNGAQPTNGIKPPTFHLDPFHPNTRYVESNDRAVTRQIVTSDPQGLPVTLSISPDEPLVTLDNGSLSIHPLSNSAHIRHIKVTASNGTISNELIITVEFTGKLYRPKFLGDLRFAVRENKASTVDLKVLDPTSPTYPYYLDFAIEGIDPQFASLRTANQLVIQPQVPTSATATEFSLAVSNAYGTASKTVVVLVGNQFEQKLAEQPTSRISYSGTLQSMGNSVVIQAIGADRVLVMDQVDSTIHVYDPTTDSIVDSYQLVARPKSVTYSPTDNALFAAYQNGRITKLPLNDLNPREASFATIDQEPYDIIAASGNLVVWREPASIEGWSGMSVINGEGVITANVGWVYPATYLQWNEHTQRVSYVTNFSPRDIASVALNVDGTIHNNIPLGGLGSKIDTPLHGSPLVGGTLRASTDGTKLYMSAGGIFDAENLKVLGRLPVSNVTDTVPFSDRLLTINVTNHKSLITAWDTSTLDLPGAVPLANWTSDFNIESVIAVRRTGQTSTAAEAYDLIAVGVDGDGVRVIRTLDLW